MPFDPKARRVTRRRALTVMAAAASLPLFGGARAADDALTLEWRGRALGGPARIVIRHPDEARARRLVGHCMREIERLETIFSLYRPDSELVRLNAAGRLAAPSQDLRRLLATARRFGKLSSGAFDVTVQPLWRAYQAHFAADPEASEGPALAEALRHVGYSGIDLVNGGAALARPGMAVTLNGIAQGYITDRIADMLRDAGLAGVLVDLGEIRALDAPGGDAWRIGIEDPRAPGNIATQIDLAGAALATSGGYGTLFDRAGRFHHLFDPSSGRSAQGCLSATAVASDATTADALATALAVAGPARAAELSKAFGGLRARLVLPDDSVMEFAA